jgi:hypothetical protein
MRHVGRAIAEQPGMFTLAFAASVLYGGMTVASAYVVGVVTDRVVLPAFATGEPSAAGLTLAVASSSGWPSCGSSASWAGGCSPASWATACRPTTAAG